MIILETIKLKIIAWCKENTKQAEKYWEIEKLVKVWAFFNRGIKPG
jgi:hypothetical protein